MKLSFMSFLFPQASATELIGMALKYGYHGIEFRAEAQHGHGVELDAPPAQIEAVRRALADAGLSASCLATSVRYGGLDAPARAAMSERCARLLDLAARLGAPCVRVFGDPLPPPASARRAEAYSILAEHLGRNAEQADQAGVRLVLETHANFRAFDAGEVLYRTGYPRALWINWHLEHCLNHGEDVDEAYRHVKGRVAHAHFMFTESYAGAIDRQVALLADEGFTGHFSVEIMPHPGMDGEALIAEHARRWLALRDRYVR